MPDKLGVVPVHHSQEPEQLLATSQHTGLFHRAASAQAAAQRQQHEAELAATVQQLRKAEAAAERYLDAFEAGTLPQAQCGPRVQALAARIADLNARRDQLHDALAALTAEPPGQEDLADRARRVREALTQGDPAARKALVRALVHEVTVESRDRIVPVFRLPAGSQPPAGAKVRARYKPLCTGVGPAAYRPDLRAGPVRLTAQIPIPSASRQGRQRRRPS